MRRSKYGKRDGGREWKRTGILKSILISWTGVRRQCTIRSLSIDAVAFAVGATATTGPTTAATPAPAAATCGEEIAGASAWDSSRNGAKEGQRG